MHLEENEKYNEWHALDQLMKDNQLVFFDKFAQFFLYQKQ